MIFFYRLLEYLDRITVRETGGFCFAREIEIEGVATADVATIIGLVGIENSAQKHDDHIVVGDLAHLERFGEIRDFGFLLFLLFLNRVVVGHTSYGFHNLLMVFHLGDINAVEDLIEFVGTEGNYVEIFIVAVAEFLVDIGPQMLDEGEAEKIEGIDARECVVCNEHIERHGISVEEAYDIAHIVESFGNEFDVADAGEIVLCLLSIVSVGREYGLESGNELGHLNRLVSR